MRISDWSSDVCSSDLDHAGFFSRRADLDDGHRCRDPAPRRRRDAARGAAGAGRGPRILLAFAYLNHIDCVRWTRFATQSITITWLARLEGRRVGKGWVGTGRFRW